MFQSNRLTDNLQTRVLCLESWNRNICCGCLNGNIYILSAKGKIHHILRTELKAPVRTLADGGDVLYSGSSEINNDSLSTIFMWGLNGTCIRTFGKDVFGLKHCLVWKLGLMVVCRDSSVIKIAKSERPKEDKVEKNEIWTGLTHPSSRDSLSHSGAVQHQVIWNDFLCTGSWDKTIRLWNLNGKTEKVLNEHPAGVMCLAVWKNHLCSGDEGGNILIWDSHTLQEIRRFKIGRTSQMCLAEWNDLMCVSSADDKIYVFNFMGEQVEVLEGHGEGAVSLLVYENKLLVAGWNYIWYYEKTEYPRAQILSDANSVLQKTLVPPIFEFQQPGLETAQPVPRSVGSKTLPIPAPRQRKSDSLLRSKKSDSKQESLSEKRHAVQLTKRHVVQLTKRTQSLHLERTNVTENKLLKKIEGLQEEVTLLKKKINKNRKKVVRSQQNSGSSDFII